MHIISTWIVRNTRTAKDGDATPAGLSKSKKARGAAVAASKGSAASSARGRKRGNGHGRQGGRGEGGRGRHQQPIMAQISAPACACHLASAAIAAQLLLLPDVVCGGGVAVQVPALQVECNDVLSAKLCAGPNLVAVTAVNGCQLSRAAYWHTCLQDISTVGVCLTQPSGPAPQQCCDQPQSSWLSLFGPHHLL